MYIMSCVVLHRLLASLSLNISFGYILWLYIYCNLHVYGSHGFDVVVLAGVTATNDIPKCYSEEIKRD